MQCFERLDCKDSCFVGGVCCVLPAFFLVRAYCVGVFLLFFFPVVSGFPLSPFWVCIFSKSNRLYLTVLDWLGYRVGEFVSSSF